ncbi:hypothetical protein OUZ56_012214 [Daphnia magna]|uniref:Secreted protein n=1 Tax=Daphnia magna TaxID=35525 RepID=A0ABQ9Z2E7_9CRUS|nr:hypothetical protein OUZ56_012214 [Daphnia magna]
MPQEWQEFACLILLLLENLVLIGDGLDPLLLALAPPQDERTVGCPRDYTASDTRSTGTPTVATGTNIRSTIQIDNAWHSPLLAIGVVGVRPLTGVNSSPLDLYA